MGLNLIEIDFVGKPQHVGQLPSTKPLRPLISFFRLRFTELCSDWSKCYFRAFWEFQKVKFLFLPFFNICPFRLTLPPENISPKFFAFSKSILDVLIQWHADAFRVSKSSKTCEEIEVFCPGIWLNVTCRVLENSHAFRFKQTPYHDKMACFFVAWALTNEINIPCDTFTNWIFCFWNYSISNSRHFALAFWASIYRKFPKYSDTKTFVVITKIWTLWLYYTVTSPNHADGMANSVDPDQAAPLGAVWSGSALFAQAYLSEKLRIITVYWVCEQGGLWQDCTNVQAHPSLGCLQVINSLAPQWSYLLFLPF